MSEEMYRSDLYDDDEEDEDEDSIDREVEMRCEPWGEWCCYHCPCRPPERCQAAEATIERSNRSLDPRVKAMGVFAELAWLIFEPFYEGRWRRQARLEEAVAE